MKLGGYKNREAWVDLSNGQIDYRPINEEYARKYIGARGLGVRYMLDNGPKVEPLSAENLLCVMTGPLTGTRINMSGRLCVVTKSPLTGTVTDSHMGGWTAARLKWAGFDNLIFKGKSDKPVYLYVENGQAQLKDASEIWGKSTRETIAYMKEKYGEDDLSVMTIGVAGENQVRFANFINEHDRASGRGGTGAVAGFKNLKAIVIKAAQKGNMPEPANSEKFPDAQKKALQAIMESPVTAPKKGGLSVYGTNVLTNITNEIGALPTKNSQVSHFDQAEEHSGEMVNKTIKVNDPTCHACPVACKIEVEVKEGPYKTRVESYEYESAWALGANCFNANREAIAKMIDLCNEYGFDTIEMGNVLSTAMEAAEKGLVQESIPWGDADRMIELITETAYRRGVGNTFAEGTGRVAVEFGDSNMAMVVKNQAIPAYDPRGIQGIGLGYATSNRGACHLRGYSVASEVMGIPEPTDRQKAEGKGALLKLFQDLHSFSDSLDICKFSAFAENVDHYAEQYSAVVGIDITADDVLKIGERIYNLERYFNNLAGFDGKDDLLPKRFLDTPGTGGSEGEFSKLPQMLKEYYEVRGWEEGVVPESKLKELEIIA